MALNVGSIYYEVEADTSKLVNSSTSVDATLDKMNKRFGQTDKAANQAQFQMTKTAAAVKGLGKEADSASSSLGGLTKVFGGLLTLQGVTSLINMAEAYGEMSERVKMATASQAEYEMVQKRLLDTANGTYRSLSEASEVYIRTADSLRAMGYSTAGAIDVVDSLSYLFVTNATSADRANGAIGAFTKSLNKGKVEADGWESLLAAVPTIINDIASASGKTAEEIRKMGVSGEITAQMLTSGLATSLDKNKDAAASMATNLKDAFRAFNNSLSVYLGEANNASGATGVLSSAIIELSKHIDVIVKTLAAAGAGAMAAYIANTTRAALASASAAVASLRAAQAKAEEAKASALAAGAAGANATVSTTEAAALNAGAAAATKKTGALLTMASAQRAATSAGAALIGALGGLTGIVGLVAAVATGFVLLGSNAKSAVPGVNELTNAIDQLGEAQLKLRQQQAAEALEKTQRRITELAGEVRMLEKDFGDLSAGPGVDDKGLENVRKTIVEARADLQTAEKSAADFTQALQKINQEMDRRTDGGIGRPTTKPSDSSGDPETAKRLQAMREELALSKLQGAERAKLAAVQRLGANATKPEREEAEKLAEAIYRNSEANKSVTDSTKASVEARKKDRDVLAGMAQDLQLAALSGEALAAAKAKNQLSSFATPQQIADLERMAKALFALDQQNRERQKFGSKPEDADQYIMGNASPLSGGAFDDQIARYDAEAKEEEKRYAEQQERLVTARELKIQTQKSYDQLEEEAATQHADRMAQIHQAKDQVMMKSLGDAFGQMSNDLMSYAQVAGRENKSMFEAAKAAAIAQAIVNTYTAATGAYSAMASIPYVGPILGAAAAATAVAAGMANVSAIRSQSMGGGRQYGGAVDASKMHRINENGQPEILNTASGRQYLLPNTRGEVVSNKDATDGSSAAPRVTVNVNNAPPGTQVEQRQLSDSEYIVDVMIADAQGDGRFTRYNQEVFGLRRQGR
jgi:tape measure domain-containing protein